MGRKPRKGRSVDGIVLLDKPVSFGSNQVLQRVKRLFKARKAGHTGSLDRLASGLLPICLGEATKFSTFLLNSDKRYQAVFRLGVTTATGDAEGQVIETKSVEPFTRAQMEDVIGRFKGTIDQIPPMHSAIKHKGQRLYKLAHLGLEVERKPRTITVHSLELREYGEDFIAVEVFCSKGTYIRTLAEDIGEALGCGAHVKALRRIGAGPFDASQMIALERLEQLADQGLDALDGVLVPMEAALADWPEVRLPENAAFYLKKGQPVLVPRSPTQGWVRLYASGDRFLGAGEVLDDGRIAPRRLVADG
ncbi:MAG TPA: tRNA pseudouridine(55) synthase TruB [Gammaproteobacteria bacterium]|nr:tRNA pseudouridine(55) synthase TruB [Gammaproteobacteria bacterium]